MSAGGLYAHRFFCQGFLESQPYKQSRILFMHIGQSLTSTVAWFLAEPTDGHYMHSLFFVKGFKTQASKLRFLFMHDGHYVTISFAPLVLGTAR